MHSRQGFTLIELLVVIAIIAVLAVTVILTLNPAELLKQARDSTRLSDLATLNTALAAYQADVRTPSMGTSTVVYVSIPDTSSSCASLGLPTLPAGYTYGCVTTTTLQNTDGTGWIPVNLNAISAGSPIPLLPKDSVNSTSSALYYTYVPGYEVTAALEAKKNTVAPGSLHIARAGSASATPYFRGDGGLNGYWNLDEGSGITANDVSGNGHTGTLAGGATWTSGCKASNCVTFDGVNDSIDADATVGAVTSSVTVSAWIYKPTSFAGAGSWTIMGNRNNTASGWELDVSPSGANGIVAWRAFNGSGFNTATGVVLTGDTWYHLAVTQLNGWLVIYVNGAVQDLNGAFPVAAAGTLPFRVGALGVGSGGSSWAGNIDDVRIYSRALSANEVSAIYNATR